MRDDGLFYPSDPVDAARHTINFILEVNLRMGFEFPTPIEFVNEDFKAFANSSISHEEFIKRRAPIDAFFGKDIKLNFSYDEQSAIHRCAGIGYCIHEPIANGEVDVALEVYQILLKKLNKTGETLDLWKKYFWNKDIR